MSGALAWLRRASTRQGPPPPGDPWAELCAELIAALDGPEWPRAWLTLAHDAERLGLLDRPRTVRTEALGIDEIPAYVGTDPRVVTDARRVVVEGLTVARMTEWGGLRLCPPSLARVARAQREDR